MFVLVFVLVGVGIAEVYDGWGIARDACSSRGRRLEREQRFVNRRMEEEVQGESSEGLGLLSMPVGVGTR